MGSGAKYIAHIRDDRGDLVVQDLFAHLRGVSELAEGFAEVFGAGEIARTAGLLHDVGKFAPGWQSTIRRDNGYDDMLDDEPTGGKGCHGSLGAVVLPSASGRWGPTEKLIAYIVSGHHAGLPDWEPGGVGDPAEHRLTDGGDGIEPRLRELLRTIKQDDDVKRFLDEIKPPDMCKICIPPPEYLHIWIRMIFSCLVDADCLDTERFMDSSRSLLRGGGAAISELKQRLDDALGHTADTSKQSTVNDVRARVLAKCRQKASMPSGSFSLRVPTGAGKTLSSMAFALDHALAHGKRRVIVAAPYTSIIEQTSAVYANIFGEENVIQHHSSIDPERETQRSRLATENWDAPIIVTTNVRLFESLAAARPSACRRLHNIADSVIILDEAHLIPPGLLEPSERTLKCLADHFGVTILKCSATLPIISGTIGGGAAAFEAVSPPTEIYDDGRGEIADRLRRVSIHLPAKDDGPSTWEDIAARLKEHETVLCVVDTRASARALHASMPDGTFHLSGLMCAEDRSDVIAQIKARLSLREPVRVISTQLIEAGVDIDLPVVFRAFAGLDSIVQCAGRCNREGLLDGLGRVEVFHAPTTPPPGVLRKAADASRAVLGDASELFPTDDLMLSYFKMLYKNINELDEPRSRKRMFKCDRSLCYQFRSYAKDHRMIDDAGQVSVLVPYREGAALIDELEGYASRALIRRLQRYSVNVRPKEFLAMQDNGMIRAVGKWGSFTLTMPELYLPGLGIASSDAVFQKIFIT